MNIFEEIVRTWSNYYYSEFIYLEIYEAQLVIFCQFFEDNK